MDTFLEGGVEQLEAVKKAAEELTQSEQAYKDSDRSLKAKQKELEIQRKRVEEKVNSSIKKARAELEKGYDEQIQAADKVIKEAELERKNAKAAAVSLRMKLENSSLLDENKVLNAEIKSRFKEANVPPICNNRLYYALFSPSNKIDYLICAAAILLFAGLIPFIVTSFIESGFMKVLVWILIVLFFAAIYFLIYAWTKKGAKNETITNMRTNVERIADNKKFIKKRNKNIKADPDESQYNLTEYDDRLAVAKADHEKAVANKADAMQDFENNESVEIRSRLEEEKAPVFQELEKEIDQMQEDLQTKTEKYQEALSVMEGYSAELGEKNVKPDKLDELIGIINEGKAATIEEALEALKNKKKWRQTETEDQIEAEEATPEDELEEMISEAAERPKISLNLDETAKEEQPEITLTLDDTQGAEQPEITLTLGEEPKDPEDPLS